MKMAYNVAWFYSFPFTNFPRSNLLLATHSNLHSILFKSMKNNLCCSYASECGVLLEQGLPADDHIFLKKESVLTPINDQ